MQCSIMKLNTKFIKSLFQNIEQIYHLKWITQRDHYMTLEDDKIRLMIGSDRWEEGVTLSFISKSKNEFYYLWDIMEKNALPSDTALFYTVAEKALSDTLNDDDGVIHLFKVLLERYCSEALRGNFSKLGKGRELC